MEYIRERESYQPKDKKKLPIIIIADALDDAKQSLLSRGTLDGIFWLQKPLQKSQLDTVVAQSLTGLVSVSRGAMQ